MVETQSNLKACLLRTDCVWSLIPKILFIQSHFLGMRPGPFDGLKKKIETKQNKALAFFQWNNIILNKNWSVYKYRHSSNKSGPTFRVIFLMLFDVIFLYGDKERTSYSLAVCYYCHYESIRHIQVSWVTALWPNSLSFSCF